MVNHGHQSARSKGSQGGHKGGLGVANVQQGGCGPRQDSSVVIRLYISGPQLRQLLKRAALSLGQLLEQQISSSGAVREAHHRMHQAPPYSLQYNNNRANGVSALWVPRAAQRARGLLLLLLQHHLLE